jgi:hypothetical protein
MRRFIMNRWWTFILALSVGLASTVATYSLANASGYIGDDGTPGDWQQPGGPGLPPPSAGDPDLPVPSSKQQIIRGSSERSVNPGAVARTEGDGRGQASVWMLRLRVVLELLAKGYNRF